jgi:hypothetical protein
VVCLGKAVGLQRHKLIHCPVREVIQSGLEQHPGASGATGWDLEVVDQARVVEVVSREGKPLAASDSLAAALELVKSDVDPELGQTGERTLHSLPGRQVAEITRLAASRAQQFQIGAARKAEDRRLGQRDQTCSTRLEPALDGRQSLFDGDRTLQETRQVACEPQQHACLVQGSPGARQAPTIATPLGYRSGLRLMLGLSFDLHAASAWRPPSLRLAARVRPSSLQAHPPQRGHSHAENL